MSAARARAQRGAAGHAGAFALIAVLAFGAVDRRSRLAARVRHGAVPVVRAAAAPLHRDRRASPCSAWRGATPPARASPARSRCLLALCGIAAALWQQFVAAKSASCNLTLADRIMTATRLDTLLPSVFEARASCADAAVDLLGVPYAIWAALAFALCGIALVRVLHANA